MKTTLQWALTYIGLGWKVFPIWSVDTNGRCLCGQASCTPKNIGKHPNGTLAPHGVDSASSQLADIKRWFTKGTHNLALATGKESGVTVVDVDIAEGKKGAASWAKLIEGHEEPQTLTAKTGSGGMHVFFQYAEGLASKNNLLGEHVDVKNKGGYVVVCPSRHRSGGAYEWLNWGTPIAVWPEHFVPVGEKKKRDGPRNDEGARRYTLEEVRGMLEVIPADDRGDWLNFGIILGRVFNRSDEAWKVYEAWAGKWTGTKARGHDKAMHEAFHVTSQQATDKPLSMGTIIFKAQQHGWIEDVVNELNAHHAIVMVGGRCVVLTEVEDAGRKEKTITLSRASDFTLFYKNRSVQVGKRRMDLGTYWLQHPARRQYQRVVFAPEGCEPDQYNLWRGFSVKPVKGDCSLYLAHLQWTICRGNDEHYRWLLTWMAHIVQHPADLPGTSVVMRGKEGTGKGVKAKWFGRLFGQHYVHLSKSRHLVGNFNAHLREALVVFVDEAFWAGDKSAEGALKALITEERHLIEFKGIDAIQVDNFTHYLISSNHDWVVPAGHEARRFFVLDVGDDHREDHAYFAAIETQMANGGSAALLYELLHYDCRGVNLRLVPKTDALMDQKQLGMSPMEKWWFECLERGNQVYEGWQTELTTSEVYEAYIHHAGKAGVNRKGTEMELAGQLSRLVPGIKKGRKWTKRYGQESYRRCWTFPDLATCRKAFDTQMHWTYKWEEIETDLNRP